MWQDVKRLRTSSGICFVDFCALWGAFAWQSGWCSTGNGKWNRLYETCLKRAILILMINIDNSICYIYIYTGLMMDMNVIPVHVFQWPVPFFWSWISWIYCISHVVTSFRSSMRVHLYCWVSPWIKNNLINFRMRMRGGGKKQRNSAPFASTSSLNLGAWQQ